MNLAKKCYLSSIRDGAYLYQRTEDGREVVISRDREKITDILIKVIDHGNCIIKASDLKDIVVIQDVGSKSFICIKDAEKFLNSKEYYSVARKIASVADKNGYIDMDKRNIDKTKKRNTGKSGRLIKYAMIALAGIVIAVGSKKAMGSSNIKDPIVVEYATLAEANYDLPEVRKTPSVVETPIPDAVKPINVVEKETPSVEVVPETVVMPSAEIKAEPEMSAALPEEDNSTKKVMLEFDDLSETDKALFAKENYYNTMVKYASKYGLDPNLVLSIATQERGVHSDMIDNGGAIGLMQMQYSIWAGKPITYYELNSETGNYERHRIDCITDDMLKDEEWNINLGCMYLQECMITSKYNIPLAIQMYNMGCVSIDNIVKMYANDSGKSASDIYNNPEDIGWLNYRDTQKGDPNYLEHVNDWADSNSFNVVNVFTGEKVSMSFDSLNNSNGMAK
jgi:soluble lytic murein transglycosylase